MADLRLIGRATELQQLEANVARARHTLLVGPVGIGKSHLLRVLHERLPSALYLDSVKPLRVTLLALCQALHARQALVLADGDAGTVPWPDCARRVGRLNIRELTDVLVASLHGRGMVLIVDQLEGVTPSMLPTLERLLEDALIVGATSRLTPSCQKLWWAFEAIEVPPLSRDEVRQLLWALAAREQIADPEMFEAKIWEQASGNPLAVVELVKQISGSPAVSRQAIRDLHHGAGVRYFDLTPVVLLAGAGIIATRFVALGLDDRDLYIIAGSLDALFLVARYLLFRGGRGPS
jgi:DNA replicative helicase MCM subunit Mcm2 (Cdc46/Mcm family)